MDHPSEKTFTGTGSTTLMAFGTSLTNSGLDLSLYIG